MGNKSSTVPSSPSNGAHGSSRVAMAPRPWAEKPAPPQPQRWAWSEKAEPGSPSAAAPAFSASSRSPSVGAAGAGAPGFGPRDAGRAADRDRGAPRRAMTPSTGTPGSGSRGSLANSPTDNFSEASSSGAFAGGFRPEEDSQQDQRLCHARKRAAESLEALQLELRGFGGAVAVRYASWPAGAALEVMPPMGTDAPPLHARLVRYDAAANRFEVELRDGSTRFVPAQQVRRVPGGGARRPATSHGVGGGGPRPGTQSPAGLRRPGSRGDGDRGLQSPAGIRRSGSRGDGDRGFQSPARVMGAYPSDGGGDRASAGTSPFRPCTAPSPVRQAPELDFLA